MIYRNYYESSLGNILLTADEEGLTGLWFAECSRYMGTELEKDTVPREMSCFDQAKEWLDIYFPGRDPRFFPKMHLTGSGFRNRVGEIMLEIPYGKTVTYGWIADRIAKERGLEKMSAQAVGGAVGHNPISIIVPCHRVIGANGNLTGYGGGIDRKIALLELEGNEMSQFKYPPLPGRCKISNNRKRH